MAISKKVLLFVGVLMLGIGPTSTRTEAAPVIGARVVNDQDQYVGDVEGVTDEKGMPAAVVGRDGSDRGTVLISLQSLKRLDDGTYLEMEDGTYQSTLDLSSMG